MKAEEPKLKFWGSPAFAMLPFGLYILLGGIFSVGYHYYSMKGLIFAAVISLLAGFFVCRNKGKYWGSVVHGLAQYGNSRLIFIFLIIGIFSKMMNTGKIVVAGTADDFLKGDVLTSVYLGGKKE